MQPKALCVGVLVRVSPVSEDSMEQWQSTHFQLLYCVLGIYRISAPGQMVDKIPNSLN